MKDDNKWRCSGCCFCEPSNGEGDIHAATILEEAMMTGVLILCFVLFCGLIAAIAKLA